SEYTSQVHVIERCSAVRFEAPSTTEPLSRSFADVIRYEPGYHSIHSKRAQDVGLNWSDLFVEPTSAEIKATDGAHRARPGWQLDKLQNRVGDILRPRGVFRGKQLREMRDEIVANRREVSVLRIAIRVRRSRTIGQQLGGIRPGFYDNALYAGTGQLVLQHLCKSFVCELARAV